MNGANFVDRHSNCEMHAKARVVVVGASCLMSVCMDCHRMKKASIDCMFCHD